MNTKKNWLTVIRVVAALVVWVGVYRGIVYLIDPWLSASVPEVIRNLICATVIPYGIALPLAYLVIRGMKTAVSDSPLMKPGFKNMAKIFIIQSGLSVWAMLPVGILIKVLDIKTPQVTADQILAQPLYYCFLLLLFAPILEEFMFRKLFLDRLMALGTRPAILISAVLFALPHLISQGPAQVFYTFVLGLSFGYVTARTRKLWPAILLHSLSNLYCGIIAAVWPKDIPVFLMAYAAIYIIAVPVTAVVLAVLNKKKLAV
ncbi:MAG: CPBP family intramembrane metalloprotease [Saccharofermentans sp.]|nr:CPBP family intramembrane metalloprotease [Saccharofermentans sp.]